MRGRFKQVGEAMKKEVGDEEGENPMDKGYEQRSCSQ